MFVDHLPSGLSMLKRFLRPAAVLLPLVMAGCVSVGQAPQVPHAGVRAVDPAFAAIYGPRPDERFPLPATDISEVDPQFLRQEVAYHGPEHPGTIVIDTASHFLYLVRENGRALRYGVGVGAEGRAWSGRAQVGRKAMWPRWTPTPDMIRREPDRNGPWAHGMPPGLGNPLGARALYLYRDGKDSMYRIHGTSEPWSIGQSVSSGCIRMFNQDVIDLFNRAPVGTPVVVLNGDQTVDSFDGMGDPAGDLAEPPRYPFDDVYEGY